LDWQEVALGELLSLSNGINADKSAYGSGLPFANVLEVITNESITESDIPGRITVTPKVQRRYEVKPGDVLFNRTSETQEEVGLASVYVGSQPVLFGGFVLRGTPLTNRLTVAYSKYAFRSAFVRGQVVARGQGGIRANIGQRDLKTVTVLLPSVAEQSAIAERLDNASGLVSSLERMITKKQAVRQGMLLQLLTAKTRLPGFTEPWSVTTLGKVGTFLKGRGVKRDDVRRTGIRCIRYGELYTAFRDYTTEARSFVSIDVAAAASPLKAGDVLFAGSGETREEIGRCVAYVGPTPAVAGGDVIIPRGDQCNPIYLALLANTPVVVRQEARAGQGDAVVHIYGHALAAVEVSLPHRVEQDAIAQVIVDVDREIDLLGQRFRKAQSVKRGMMQELVAGRSRLPVEEDVA